MARGRDLVARPVLTFVVALSHRASPLEDLFLLTEQATLAGLTPRRRNRETGLRRVQYPSFVSWHASRFTLRYASLRFARRFAIPFALRFAIRERAHVIRFPPCNSFRASWTDMRCSLPASRFVRDSPRGMSRFASQNASWVTPRFHSRFDSRFVSGRTLLASHLAIRFAVRSWKMPKYAMSYHATLEKSRM
ncbi:hypothetical protein G1C97_1560 [Bifidobacterium sp. DSM 109959]|uniref:Uncharacterized protein n=1 Tax=Bifidobacterium olomucense TaxID=2675324 RepID=A0A7Y0EYQ4_9BIFI|nr:hypothetical protein [Bifidobacterium sp. DSM 109959]